ncbi:MAG: AAA family ATPase [Patescibacteria group bacterium]
MSPLLFSLLAVALLLLVVLWKQDFFHSKGMGTMMEQYAKDLTAMARRGELDPIIGRKEEINRVIQTLGRRTKDNVVLIGNAGVGKTAIVEGLAQAIVAGMVPPSLLGKRVLALDLNALVAGTKYRGDFEKRMMKISEEIRSAKRNFIVLIDEIHTLTMAGQGSGAMSAGDILKPALARGDLQVIGATTPLEYEKYIKQDTTLERRLQPLLIRETTGEDTLAILRGIVSRYENHHGVKINDSALVTCVDLADTYLPGRFFPDKAIDLMDETASKVKLENLGKPDQKHQPEVTEHDVETVVTAQTKSLI